MKRSELADDRRLSTEDQKRLSREFLEHIYRLPDGERIKLCIQCGTCSGSCPTAGSMEFSPREIIAALRAGMLDRVLRTNTVWYCTSCYYCTVRCPQKIKFTDVMYELKRLGIMYGLYPKDSGAPILSRTFAELVDLYGRNPETLLMQKYYFRVGLLKALDNVSMAKDLYWKGRLGLAPKKIKGTAQIQKILAHVLSYEAEGDA
ncbi:MAG: 4Fe-4S dicluster domain-containing protein [bacterium]|jgi:heterodisulfide reductase subunit C